MLDAARNDWLQRPTKKTWEAVFDWTSKYPRRDALPNLPDFIRAHLADPQHPMPLQPGVRLCLPKKTAK